MIGLSARYALWNPAEHSQADPETVSPLKLAAKKEPRRQHVILS